MGQQAPDAGRQDRQHRRPRAAAEQELTRSPTALPTLLAAPGPPGVRARRARAAVWVAGGAVTAAAVGWLHRTGGYDVAPAGLLSCPFHAVTGWWCPFCGGLRCVAAVSRGDLTAAASANVVVLTLLPVLAAWWVLGLRAAATGRPHPWPRVGNRAWLLAGALLLVFTVWRNLPALPLGAYLAP